MGQAKAQTLANRLTAGWGKELAEEAADCLREQAEEINRLRYELEACRADKTEPQHLALGEPVAEIRKSCIWDDMLVPCMLEGAEVNEGDFLYVAPQPSAVSQHGGSELQALILAKLAQANSPVIGLTTGD